MEWNMNSFQGIKQKKSKATIVTTVVSCHRVPKPLRNFKLKQGFTKKEPLSGRKSLESSSSFLSSGTSSLHTNSSSAEPPPTTRRILPPDEYYEFGDDKIPQTDQDDGLGRSSESCMESPLVGASASSSPSVEPGSRKSVTPSERGTTSTTHRQSLEGDSGHGDFEEELQFSSISSPSQFDPISETESDSCSYTYSYYTCSNSCCSGSYSEDDEEYFFSRTESEESYASDNTELQRDAEEAADRESRAVAAVAAQAALSKSYRAYFRRVEKLKRTLETWDNFLKDNGISRPDFFCRYKERESLQQIVDEFNEVTKRHREGILGALRSAAAASVSSSSVGDERRSISTGPSLTGSESNLRKNIWRTKRIRKLLAIGTFPPEEAEDASRDSGNDASSSNEAAHLQQRLKSLSSELVTLRNRLHVNGNGPGGGVATGPQQNGSNHTNNNGAPSGHNSNSININHNNGRPQIPPHGIIQATTITDHSNGTVNGNATDTGQPPQATTGSNLLRHHQILNSSSYHNKPLPPHPGSNNGTLNSHLSNGSGGSSSNNAVNGGGSSGGSSNNGFYVNQNFQKDVLRSVSTGGVIVDGTSPSNGNTSGSNHSSENGKLGVHVVGGIGSSSNGTLGGAVVGGGGSAGGGTSVNGINGGGSSGSIIGTTTTTSGGDATQSESSFRLSTKSGPVTLSCPRKVSLADTEDLIHLSGPLTEDALIRCLQARCSASKYFTYMGPILLTINPLNDVGNPLTLGSTKEVIPSPPIQKVVQEALRQQGDTGYPQAIILSGCSGSGKTYTSMLVLKQLFELAGGGMETDAFKHLAASVTVIRSLGTARTASNRESSRIGHFIEVQVTDGTVYRTKVHCYFLDQTRVVRTRPDESNYHIFYQMMAGLTAEEREKLHLGDHSVETLRYLKSFPRDQEEGEDAKRFFDWKAALGVLGIPYLDVVRVLAAVLLLGNVQFKESSSCLDVEVEVKGEKELQAAASLLGCSEAALRQGLTTRTHNARNQLVRSRCDANLSNLTRDALAKSLYCRTVATIVRRANSLKRLCSTSGTLSSDSADSAQNQAEVLSQHASTVGTAGSRASKSMTALNNAVRHATDGFIGILDMFGFEDVKPSHLEHLCINLCAETMQHFYNTHIFKACIESCRDEGIQCDWEVDYVDNVPCIDLISSLRTGLLSMLDVECSVRGTVESYIQKVRTQHKQNPRLMETKHSDLRSFAIQHYASKVQYDATDFLDTNRDTLADDLVAVFHKHRCSFGFASHLFSSELKILGAGGIEPSPRGISFRISPTSHSELLNGDEPVSTLTQDFHTRLDNLLRTLVHARPHFIRCIKVNNNEQADLFDRHTVSKQLRAFQVLETVNLMAYGYPHRMRFKAFNARYRSLALFHQLARTDDRAIEDCQVILEFFENSIDGCTRERLGHISISWAIGKRHVFLSEGARQQLEALRMLTQNRAATLIQSTWRGWRCRRRWPIVRQGYHMKFQQTMPPTVPPPNVPTTSSSNTGAAPPTLSFTKLNGLMTARSTSHHESMGHAIITSTSFLNTVNHTNTNGGSMSQNGNIRAPTSSSMPLLQQQLSPAGGPMQHNQNDIPQSHGKPFKYGVDEALPLSSNSDNSISSHAPVPAPRSGSMGPQLPPTTGATSLNAAKSLPNIPPPRSNSNASGAAVSPISGGEGSCNSSNSVGGGLGYPPSNPPGSVCSSTGNSGGRPRPQPIAGTPPPEAMDRCDAKLVQQTCNMFGLDMERPPPLPPSRSYTVAGNTKLGYPQTRIMKMTFPDESTISDIRLMKGEKVVVVGASSRRGHLMVEFKNRTIHVPFQYLELKTAAVD